MSINNWGIINNGGVFESLMHAILHTENAKVSLFCRSGKDNAIDARSEDGTHIYQAKYSKNMTMDSAIVLAKREFDEFYALLKGEAQKVSYDEFFAPVYIMNAINRSLVSGKEETINY